LENFDRLPQANRLQILDSMIKPDYENASIVNLMASILQGLGQHSNQHSALKELDSDCFARARHVVLLVIDGLGYNYLSVNAPRSALHKFIHSKLTTVFPSTTATAITAFMTGLAPQQHGLTGWFTYFQELGSILTVLPVKPRFGGASLGELNIDVPSLYGHVPVFDLLDVDGYIVSPRNIAYSDYSLAHRGKARIKPYENLTECFAFTCDIIKGDSNKKYIYTYWPQFDGMAHEKGVGSKDVADHFQDIDKAFSRFINDIKGTNTLVIATADHGIIDSGPDYCIELEHHPELQDMLTMPLSGERRMAYCYVEADRHKDFTTYLQNNLAEQITVYPSKQLLEQHFYGLGPAHPHLHHRIGDFVLATNNNHTIMDTIPGERHFYHIGTHGGLSEDEMFVPLIIVEA
jgi:Type I phosphodiesterase / nucleotide pyrophosphatase